MHIANVTFDLAQNTPSDALYPSLPAASSESSRSSELSSMVVNVSNGVPMCAFPCSALGERAWLFTSCTKVSALSWTTRLDACDGMSMNSCESPSSTPCNAPSPVCASGAVPVSGAVLRRLCWESSWTSASRPCVAGCAVEDSRSSMFAVDVS